ncbi:hypothetical protein GRO01_08800 [Gluconobacter roseus NBRC 3990]|uniref:Uncharacterized protein n=1 Tax=Gluconobacter roseus NBRC 3990 TaxID=1307950 RepID=A0A4Y3M3W9_9PROT|nr:hypothetical protein AA3990_2101 [Gluconobacter roseus NBRC 3990]GEB03304.1 hypothetical protein GRO01_08800 [Gluconobacter roseus NBRC 3990]GLP93762.1 hypothetical protein GCM10007871_17400 [Gluconobacter roseus NBRC 3990]
MAAIILANFGRTDIGGGRKGIVIAIGAGQHLLTDAFAVGMSCHPWHCGAGGKKKQAGKKDVTHDRNLLVTGMGVKRMEMQGLTDYWLPTSGKVNAFDRSAGWWFF